MASFKKLPTDFIGSQYEGGVKVILESEEDVRIFCDHWFADRQDKIRFESAEEGALGGGGCSAVIRKVQQARNQQLIAFGIIDRDVLLADEKPEIFWETDDRRFDSATPYGDRIHVLRRWELENYLLKPEAFSAELACRVSRPPSPKVSSEFLLDLEDDLVDVTALTTFMVSKGKKSPKPGFGQDDSGKKLRDAIESHLSNVIPDTDYSHLSSDIDKIRAFSVSEQEFDKRWERLTRLVDGKKALSRICDYLNHKFNIKSLCPWEEMRGCLADKIASRKVIDDELLKVIEDFATAI